MSKKSIYLNICKKLTFGGLFIFAGAAIAGQHLPKPAAAGAKPHAGKHQEMRQERKEHHQEMKQERKEKIHNKMEKLHEKMKERKELRKEKRKERKGQRQEVKQNNKPSKQQIMQSPTATQQPKGLFKK